MSLEIKPRISEGEPFCDQGCPYFDFTEYAGCKVLAGKCKHGKVLGYAMIDTLCTPGLRQQRDDARRELCMEILVHSGFENRAEVACDRGWGYLYE